MRIKNADHKLNNCCQYLIARRSLCEPGHLLLCFRDDSFKVAFHWTRARFSPSSNYIAVGSQDGTVFVWNTLTSKLDKKLKEMRWAAKQFLSCSGTPLRRGNLFFY